MKVEKDGLYGEEIKSSMPILEENFMGERMVKHDKCANIHILVTF